MLYVRRLLMCSQPNLVVSIFERILSCFILSDCLRVDSPIIARDTLLSLLSRFKSLLFICIISHFKFFKKRKKKLFLLECVLNRNFLLIQIYFYLVTNSFFCYLNSLSRIFCFKGLKSFYQRFKMFWTRITGLCFKYI